MIVQMDTDIPRFDPIPYGSGIDYPAASDGTPGSGADSGRRRSHRRPRLVARAVSDAYRWRVVILALVTCATGTAFTIYSSTIGR